MPVYDWSSMEAGGFHDFHTVWISAIRSALNEGLLPPGYYALAEQHAGQFIADVLTLHADPEPLPELPPLPPDTGGIAVAEAPPRARIKQTFEPAPIARRRSIAIRHVSGHRLIALMEIVSPANKDRSAHVNDFVTKMASALERGVHVFMVDLFPPGAHDPQGLHGALRERLLQTDEPYDLPAGCPLTVASYAAGARIEAYLEHFAVGAALSDDMPLFLRTNRYVHVPLEATYAAAFRGMPAFWRDVLTGA